MKCTSIPRITGVEMLKSKATGTMQLKDLRLSRRGLLCAATATVLTEVAVMRRHPAAAKSVQRGSALREVLLDRVLGEALYRPSFRLDITPDGAVGQNRDGLLYVELQGQGIELIRRGLYFNDPSMTRQGWQAFDWGIARQNKDGGFGQNDDFHSATIYLTAFGQCLLLDPAAATPERLTALERGIAWVSHPRNSIRGMTRNLGFAHRFWLVAAMYDAAAALLDRPDLARRGTVFALDGARLQEPDGTNLERGGYDVGYHMVGLVIASRYLLTTSDDVGREAAMAMLPRGFDRHMQSIRADGTIDAEGSTRMGKEKNFGGTIKRVSSAQAREGYFMAWRLLKDDRYWGAFEHIRPDDPVKVPGR